MGTNQKDTMKQSHFFLNIRSTLSTLAWLMLGFVASAQFTNTGLPVSITEQTVFTLDASFHTAGPLTNQGSLVVKGDEISIGGTYTGAGSLSADGHEQRLDLRDARIASLALTSGDKRLISDAFADNLMLSEVRVFTDGRLLTVAEEISGATDESYVIGKLVRTSGGDSLLFPLGSDGTYMPVVFREIEGSDVQVAVELVEGNANGLPGRGLLAVADNRYWKVSGTFDAANIELPVVDEKIASEMSRLSVATSEEAGGIFNGLGQVSASGDLTKGKIRASGKGGPGVYTLGKFFDESLRVSDSLALVSIYQSTRGNAWHDDFGWLAQDLDNWRGVSITDKRVSALDLSENNLQDTVPELMDGLEALETLDLSANEIVEIAGISSLEALHTLDVSENRLQFATLEDVLKELPDAKYSPQKEVLESIRVLQETGTEYTLDRTLSGSANSYNWTKDGVELGQSNASFEIAVEDFSVDGIYVAHVTNEQVPGLTLTTRPIMLRVSSLQRDSISLQAVYDALSGENSRVSDWKRLPLASWQEVVIANNRVTEIDLSGKGLSGEVPMDITDVQGLQTVDLSDNEISGLPELVGSLPDLTSFDVRRNRLEFDDLQKNIELAQLNYANQKPFGTLLHEVIPVGSDYELHASAGGEGNQYQWWRISGDAQRPIDGAHSPSFTLSGIGYATMGDYVLKVTNPAVPGLTLQSEVQNILASASLEFTGMGIDGPIREGTGYALKIREPGTPYDSVAMVTANEEKFLFEELILGDYLIALEGDDALYVPTYFRNTDLWAEADTLLLRGSVSDTITMTLKPGALDPNEGNGKVYGLVQSEFNEEGESDQRVNARRKVKKAGCSMRRRTRGGGGRTQQEEVWELMAYVETNDEGQFEFANIPSGLYRFNIEYPGIPMNPESYVEFNIGNDGIENNTFFLEAFITEEGIEVVRVEELGFQRKYFKNLVVYPVPADDFLHIKYDQLMAESVQVHLMDLSGTIIHRQEIKKGYEQEIRLEVSHLSPGYYVLHFVDSGRGGQAVMTCKLFIHHE